ncbi:MAG: polysaccharide biosynthesis C-terminal domain-containing protein [Bacteroidota bacterium]
MIDLRLAFHNLVWNHGGKLAEIAVAFLFSVSVARMLGVQLNGTYILLITFIQTGLLVTSYGLETTLHRFVPRFCTEKVALRGLLRPLFIFRVVLLLILLCLLFFGLPFLFVYFSIQPFALSIVLLLCFYAFLNGINNFFGAVLIGQSRTQLLSLLRVIVRIGELIGVIVCGMDGLTINEVLTIIVLGAFASTLVHCIVSWVDIAGERVKGDSRPVFSFAGTMWLNAFIVFVLGKQMDILLLGKFAVNVNEIALYDIAMMLVQIVVMGTTVGMGGVMLATFSVFAQDQPGGFQSFWRFWVKITILLIVPLLIILLYGADEIIPLIYTSSYALSKNLVRVLACFIIIERLFGSGMNADALLAIGKQKTLLWISILSGALNIVIALVLIPYFGALGAIIATGTANCVTSILMAQALRRYEHVVIPFFFWLRIVVITTAACSIPYALNMLYLPFILWYQLILTVLLWAAFAKGIGLFSENDIRWLEKMNPAAMRVAYFFRIRLP